MTADPRIAAGMAALENYVGQWDGNEYGMAEDVIRAVDAWDDSYCEAHGVPTRAEHIEMIVEQAKADERERIAQEIEAMAQRPTVQQAARIARGQS